MLKMKKSFPFLLFCLLSLAAFPQVARENNWKFGYYAGVDFTGGVPVYDTSAMYTAEGVATISDLSGNLLFYTNGNMVYDRNHVQMPNGISLGGSSISAQSAVIVPVPGNAQQYYIFTVTDWMVTTAQLQYSIVDMTLNGGMGDVSAVQNILLPSNAREQLAAIAHTNGQDAWVLCHVKNDSVFHAYRITPAGVDSVPVASAAGMIYSGNNRYGSLHFSHNCQKLVSVLGSASTVGVTVQLFDFDAGTGIVSNPVTVALWSQVPTAYGAEFSPNDTRLYVTSFTENYIQQFDLTSANIPASMVNVSDSINDDKSNLLLGPDNKIYISMRSRNYMNVILYPDSLGQACTMQDSAVMFPSYARCALGFPNFMRQPCIPTSVKEVTAENSLSVYPNPAQGVIHLRCHSSSKAVLSIYTTHGRLVSVQPFSETVSVAPLTNGIYFIKVEEENKMPLVCRFVKISDR